MALKVWNGSSWDPAQPKVWSGAAWGTANKAYVWNGSAWVQFYPSLKYSGTVALDYITDYTTYEAVIYQYGSGLGSATPSTLTDGKTFFILQTEFSYPSSFLANTVAIDGFSSDPGASYLTEIKIGPTTYSLPTAGYAYASGTAYWYEYSAPWFTAAGSFSVELYGT